MLISQKNNETLKEKQRLLESTRTEFNKISGQMSKLVGLRADQELTKEQFGREYAPLEDRYHQIKKQRPELEAEIDFLNIHLASSETVLDEAKNLYERWDSLPFDNKRSIVEVITDKIVIGKTNIEIELSYSPSPHILLSFENSGKGQHSFRDTWTQSA